MPPKAQFRAGYLLELSSREQRNRFKASEHFIYIIFKKKQETTELVILRVWMFVVLFLFRVARQA